jgi:hypothetical protein
MAVLLWKSLAGRVFRSFSLNRAGYSPRMNEKFTSVTLPFVTNPITRQLPSRLRGE